MGYLKWVGSKSKLLIHLEPYLPRTFKNYYEPFVGSGALFFWLEQKYAWDNDRKYFLSDSNEYLINCHIVVSTRLSELKSILEEFKNNDSKDFFLTQRKLTANKIDIGNDIEAAARFIYLNRRAWGGMWRVNQSGVFNVPFCDSQNSQIIPKSISMCSQSLKKADLRCGDYRLINPSKDDFVFIDPPYYPLSKTSNFTGYTPDDWNEEDHKSMMLYLKDLNSKGVKFLMTNNDCAFVRDNCSDFKIKTQPVTRYIDAIKHHSKKGTKNKEKRDIVNECFVWNYNQDNWS